MKKFLVILSLFSVLMSCTKEKLEKQLISFSSEGHNTINSVSFTIDQMSPEDQKNIWANETVGDKRGDLGVWGDAKTTTLDKPFGCARGNSLLNNGTYSGIENGWFTGFYVIDRALGGSRFREAKAMIKYTYFSDSKFEIVYGGENEREVKWTNSAIVADAQAYVLELRKYEPNAKIIFIGEQLCPVYAHLRNEIIEYNNIMKQWISTLPNAVYVDVFYATLDVNGNVRPELFRPDGKHFPTGNCEGYRIWKTQIAPHMPNIVETPPVDTAVIDNMPVAIASADATFNLSLMTFYAPTVSGTASHDVNGGWIKAAKWDKIAGPASCLIQKPTQLKTPIGFLAAGVYVFRLTVIDNEDNTSYDDVQITIRNDLKK